MLKSPSGINEMNKNDSLSKVEYHTSVVIDILPGNSFNYVFKD
nr:8701_t:CDS:2 [Entrophospora candida]